MSDNVISERKKHKTETNDNKKREKGES